VDGTVVLRPSAPVEAGALIELDDPEHWVARSAHKLLGALTDLEADGALAPDAVAGAVCLDAGASTGGFTQVLLERGAAAVHAVDVGHDQLVPALAGDARVHDLPGTNVRALTRTDLAARSDPPFRADGTVDLVVADLSFISLTLVVDALLAVCRPQAILLLMVKPQFELSRSALDKHGVVTREADRPRRRGPRGAGRGRPRHRAVPAARSRGQRRALRARPRPHTDRRLRRRGRGNLHRGSGSIGYRGARRAAVRRRRT
jgi:23S rRNA (cytidine1920-2'-O)/16S rRNA (cytidine1409-2'-O)-methyltransferase